jgi:hypothetical protein
MILEIIMTVNVTNENELRLVFDNTEIKWKCIIPEDLFLLNSTILKKCLLTITLKELRKIFELDSLYNI